MKSVQKIFGFFSEFTFIFCSIEFLSFFSFSFSHNKTISTSDGGKDPEKVKLVFLCLPSEPEAVQSLAVVLDNVGEHMTRDLLSMLVENVSGLDESSYSLEIIQESSRAVITFNSPAGKTGQDSSK